MTLEEIANTLVEGCRKGEELANLDVLYAPDAVSIEPRDMEGQPEGSRRTEGLDGIKGKHAWFDSAIELHEQIVEGPFLHGTDRFAVCFKIDATDRESGKRMPMHDVGVYTVENGKIVQEEFFY